MARAAWYDATTAENLTTPGAQALATQSLRQPAAHVECAPKLQQNHLTSMAGAPATSPKPRMNRARCVAAGRRLH